MQKVVTIEGMMCQHCVDHITKSYEELDGVSCVRVDLAAGMATLEVTDCVSDDALAAIVNDAGFILVGIA